MENKRSNYLVQQELNEFIKSHGYYTKNSFSENEFGKSYYIYVWRSFNDFLEKPICVKTCVKIRISDHGVTNHFRINEELHYWGQSNLYFLKEIQFILHRHDFFEKREITEIKKAYNVQTYLPNDTDVVTETWVAKKTKKTIYSVTRTYTNQKIAWFDKQTNTLYKVID